MIFSISLLSLLSNLLSLILLSLELLLSSKGAILNLLVRLKKVKTKSH